MKPGEYIYVLNVKDGYVKGTSLTISGKIYGGYHTSHIWLFA